MTASGSGSSPAIETTLMELPITKQPDNSRIAGSQAEATVPARPVLLVADDDEGVRAALEVVFESAYEVLVAADGQRALDLIACRAVDVVILDLNMPGLSGIETLENIKRQDPWVEVIILTGQATLESARQALQFGAFAYLNKPFEMKEGRNTVERALNRRRQIQSWQALELELRQRQIEQEIERVKSEIYATVIHDLNSPLTTALGLLDMMRLDLQTGQLNLSQVDQYVHDARTQLDFCAAIIKRYLNFMRQPTGQKAASDLTQVMEDLRKLIRVHPAVRQNRLLIHVPDEQLQLRVNGLDLLQVLLNLTVNALQSSENNHHVEVYCRHLPPDLVARTIKTGVNDAYLFGERLADERPMVSITVQDDGAGIPASILPSVLSAYYTTKAAGIGTGLGLSVVQRIISANDGALHIHSVPGEGTAFTVFFPLA
ncbi:MAG TPA: hypothetical protein DCY13_19745 [Verrucomicrobiales bacterium]|nr:hypothetical protein [Verrucomicrobiales bacterium]